MPPPRPSLPAPSASGGGAARSCPCGRRRSRGSATWSALRRGPSSTSSSPPTPTRWARAAGRETGGHLCEHRTRRGAPSAGRRARPCPPPPARPAGAGRSLGALVRVPGLTRAVRGGTAEAWPGLPLSPPAAPRRSPGDARGRGAGGRRRGQKRK